MKQTPQIPKIPGNCRGTRCDFVALQSCYQPNDPQVCAGTDKRSTWGKNKCWCPVPASVSRTDTERKRLKHSDTLRSGSECIFPLLTHISIFFSHTEGLSKLKVSILTFMGKNRVSQACELSQTTTGEKSVEGLKSNVFVIIHSKQLN